MLTTFALFYLGAWAITTGLTYVASRRLADGPTTPGTSFGYSLLAGLVWPLMLLGVVEVSSVVVYAAAKTWRHDSRVPESWLGSKNFDNVVVPLR